MRSSGALAGEPAAARRLSRRRASSQRQPSRLRRAAARLPPLSRGRTRAAAPGWHRCSWDSPRSRSAWSSGLTILNDGGGGGDGGQRPRQATAGKKCGPAAVPEPAKPAPHSRRPRPRSHQRAGTSTSTAQRPGVRAHERGPATPGRSRCCSGGGGFPDGSTDLTLAYALYNLGRSLRLAGRPHEAIPDLERRLQFKNQRGVVKKELARRRGGMRGG